jgi:hypothetical protein
VRDNGCKRGPHNQDHDAGFFPCFFKSREAHEQVDGVDAAITDVRQHSEEESGRNVLKENVSWRLDHLDTICPATTAASA